MTHETLIRRLQISCLGLDAIDPLRLLVDDVIAALAQTQRTWVGLTDEDRYEFAAAQHGWENLLIAAEAKLKEKNCAG